MSCATNDVVLKQEVKSQNEDNKKFNQNEA